MPYTNKSLVFLWLTIGGLVAMTASGVIAGAWLLLLALVALAAPALILRTPGVTTTSHGPGDAGVQSETSRIAAVGRH